MAQNNEPKNATGEIKMDNRRSFFKSLALIGSAAVGCPGIFIPKFESIKWKLAERKVILWDENGIGTLTTSLILQRNLELFAKSFSPIWAMYHEPPKRITSRFKP